MRVAYFANQFVDRQGHGLARYARELHRALGELEQDIDVAPVAAWSSLATDVLTELQQDSGLRILPSGRLGTSLGWTFAGQPRLEWMLPTPVDVVHAVALGYPIATAKPLVVTIHDLGPLTRPEFFSHNRPWVMRAALKQAATKADAIICISHSTADEVRSICKQPLEDRLHVIHSGVSSGFFLDHISGSTVDLDFLEAGTPYILTAGKISPRKNVQGVMKALKIALKELPHHLVVTGGAGWDEASIMSVLDDSNLRRRVHFLGYVDDAQLIALYGGASAYVHPSFYEGFGLTVLEAMAAGAPVITSNVSSLPEVAGDAAVLVNPFSTEDIANAVVTVASNADLRSQLRAAGRSRAASFTWRKTAEQTLRVYQGVTNQ